MFLSAEIPTVVLLKRELSTSSRNSTVIRGFEGFQSIFHRHMPLVIGTEDELTDAMKAYTLDSLIQQDEQVKFWQYLVVRRISTHRHGTQDRRPEYVAWVNGITCPKKGITFKKAVLAKLEEVMKEARDRVLKATTLVFCTIAQTRKVHNLLPEADILVIVDEAANCQDGQLCRLGVLKPSLLLLIGDDKQCREYSEHDWMRLSQRVENRIERDVCLLALREGYHLNTQYRCRIGVGQLWSKVFYGGKVGHGENVRQVEDALHYPGLVMVDTSHQSSSGQRLCNFPEIAGEDSDDESTDLGGVFTTLAMVIWQSPFLKRLSTCVRERR